MLYRDLTQLGQLIDQAVETKDIVKLDRAIDRCQQVLMNHESTGYRKIVYYYLANAWSGKRRILRIGNDSWSWEQPELEKEILNLRMALSFSEQEHTDENISCQILTNLGNSLNYVGRSVEAVEYWNRVLEKSPDFPMAHGNRGIALCYYAGSLYDQEQSS
ncbi:MAG: hypothetical protein AAGG51_00650 [Cyanobacteria bacterium P01_G01_bin.54]